MNIQQTTTAELTIKMVMLSYANAALFFLSSSHYVLNFWKFETILQNTEIHMLLIQPLKIYTMMRGVCSENKQQLMMLTDGYLHNSS